MPPLIVIAEDDTAILGLLTEVPEGEGYRVQQATDGAAALARLCAERADPLLIDQQLPRSTGLAVIAELSARVGAVLPIILMSTLIPPVLPVPRSCPSPNRSTWNCSSRWSAPCCAVGAVSARRGWIAMRESKRSVLTPAQWLVLERLAAGEDDAAITLALGVGRSTVASHLKVIYQRLPYVSMGSKRVAATT